MDQYRIVSGIYRIECIPDGMLYIGRAKNIEKRWKNHRLDLAARRHHNYLLQSAYNEYGTDNFLCSVLEEVIDLSLLIEREKYWMVAEGAHGPLFNIDQPGNANRNRGNVKINWIFITPEGKPIIVRNLKQFCRTNDLNYGVMRQLARKHSPGKSHKGWTAPEPTPVRKGPSPFRRKI